MVARRTGDDGVLYSWCNDKDVLGALKSSSESAIKLASEDYGYEVIKLQKI